MMPVKARHPASRGAQARKACNSLDLKAFYDTTLLDMLGEDFVYVCLVQVAIPDGLGVYHDHRSFRAAVQATRGIDAHAALAGYAEFLAAPLGVFTHGDGIKALAALTAPVALIDTEEHRVAVVGYGR